MSVAEQIYLTAAITAFIFFGTTLFSIYIWTGVTPRDARPPRKPLSLLVAAFLISVACATVVGRIADQAASAPDSAPQLSAQR